MTELTKAIEVPFVKNTGKRCVPACTAMLLKTLLPERMYSARYIESLSGFREGYSTWAAQHLLSLDALGIEVGWIQDEDLASFAQQPDEYMLRQFGNQASLDKFKSSNDLGLEAARINTYLNRGLPFEKREATREDITSRLMGSWAVRLEVNGETLADQDGYAPHAVLVSGFNDEVIRLENPDGKYGSKPKQIVSWDKLHEAWPDPTMQYYRRKQQA